MSRNAIARAGVLLGLVSFVAIVRADEEKIPLKDVPKAVLDALKAKFPAGEMKGAGKETEDDETIYEITLVDRGKHIDVSVDEEGEIEEVETEIAAGDLPKPVAESLHAKYPEATIRKAEEIVEIEDGEETKSFEVVVVTGAKKTFEVKLSPGGKILTEEEEDKDDEEG